GGINLRYFELFLQRFRKKWKALLRLVEYLVFIDEITVKRLRQGFWFLIIAAVLGAVLLFKSKLLRNVVSISLQERLPVSDVLVRIKIMELSKELSPILYKYKLPIREFASSDFLLSQGKIYGINIQQEAYMFSKMNMSEWGIILALNDSSKVINFVDRFRKSTQILDSSTSDVRVMHFGEQEIALCYEKTYALIYSGKRLAERLREIRSIRKSRPKSAWKHFFQLSKNQSGPIIAYSEGEFLKPWGIKYAMVRSKNDSTNIRLSAFLKTLEPHGIKFRRRAEGLPLNSSDTKAVELHLDSTFKHQEFSIKLASELHKLGKKIGFPTNLFLSAWDGNLSFREGGSVSSMEKIVVTEFDENFNPTETVRYQNIMVPGYSIMIGINPSVNPFMNALYTKGII
ncbi:MAG: DUF4836 family protein, partial [Flavobacteriia bacterium]|nr:DUF4836 family protein [Flavobacteriia bacterium]